VLRQDCARGPIHVARAEALDDTSVDEADLLAVARVLSGTTDPWAAARSSELFARAHRGDDAFDALERALSRVSDPDARADFWNRWSASLAALSAARAQLLRSASLALRLGDVDRAVEYARLAASAEADGGGFEPMLVLGRATAARGDLTTAAIALTKAMDRAPDAGSRARAAVEIAEVHYLAGDFEAAGRLGAEALASAGDVETRLLARNVLGKLHLASAAWVEAEQHFAADACDAACAADVVGELRARVNRAVALLSGGRRDEARELLLSVLDDGERHGEPRATVFALANLAAMATLRHDYAEALRLSERAIDARRRIGERIGLARLITNLAVLRLRVGLVAEAEAALRFGRRACGPAMPGARLPHFALVAARIHLARGKTAEAARDVAAALQAAGRSSDGGKVGECHRLAARIALEDGDTQRAGEALAAAAREATTDDARAELAVLMAMQARALGRDVEPLASRALELAIQVDDAELAREAPVLLHHAIALRGGSSSHLEAAVSLRDRVADALPTELRRTFLARRDLGDLAALEAGQGMSAAPLPLDSGVVVGGVGVPRRSSERAAGALVGEDPAMRALRAAIQKVGASDVTVLVQGESGTGKELVAEAIHAASPRRAGPLVKVNCAALVETLLLSELFGHEKGSFTGAGARRRGRFELAEGGTLFLDEIGDISSKTQVALLRVLQDKTFERVGGTTSLRANVRIVCATHRDLAAMVSRGQFREDLYYRLRGIALVVPPLRSRLSDLPRLAGALLSRIAAERHEPTKQLSKAAVDRLGEHAWPGNVRELDNALRAATLFAEGEVVELDDLVRNVPGLRAPMDAPPDTTRAAGTPPAPPSAAVAEPSTSAPTLVDGKPVDLVYAHVRAGTSLGDLKRQIEQECIARALAESQGNITHAAALLGMKRPRLSQLVKQYGLGSTEDES
jgi:DNA-binding NtrC family response regulator/tetratricopeptide (TPR) repeat protein